MHSSSPIAAISRSIRASLSSFRISGAENSSTCDISSKNSQTSLGMHCNKKERVLYIPLDTFRAVCNNFMTVTTKRVVHRPADLQTTDLYKCSRSSQASSDSTRSLHERPHTNRFQSLLRIPVIKTPQTQTRRLGPGIPASVHRVG
jgi:hypothetical protein